MPHKVVLLLILQMMCTNQQSYDEDLSLPYAPAITYRSLFSSTDITYLDNINNCTCKEMARTEAYCTCSSCKIFPAAVNIKSAFFKLKLTSVSVIRQNDLYRLKHLVALEIDANVKLVRIEPGCFWNMSKLRNLTLSANVNLKYLDENVFEGLINVEVMILQKNGFGNVIDITKALAPQFLPRIILLDLSENMFHNVKENDFYPMNGTSLSQLNMVLCQIEYMHPNCLRPLKNVSSVRLGQNILDITLLTQFVYATVQMGIPLRFLDLFDVGLRKIVPNPLMQAIGFSNISNLCLANNHFDYIDDNSFPVMPNIVTLDLRSDFISEISDNAFGKLVNLKDLYLSANKLSYVPQGVYTKTITYLNLAGNAAEGSYFNLQDAVFANMTNIQNLHLAYNFLGYLSKYAFIGLSNLVKLNLKNTSVYTIQPGAFSPLNNLLLLNLMNNPLSRAMPLTSDTFLGLSQLQILLLGGCRIKNLTGTPGLFSNMPNLTYLGLERTGLHIISPGQLSHLNYLRVLNLAENKLTGWAAIILPHSSLKILYAQQNRMTYTTPAMLEDWRNLDSLYLDGNPFTCDCTLFSTAKWLMDNKIPMLSNQSEVVARCIGPEEWDRKSVPDFLKYLIENPNICSKKSSSDDIINIFIILIASSVIVLIILWLVYKYYNRRQKNCIYCS